MREIYVNMFRPLVIVRETEDKNKKHEERETRDKEEARVVRGARSSKDKSNRQEEKTNPNHTLTQQDTR